MADISIDQHAAQSKLLQMPVWRAIFHLAWPTLLIGVLQYSVSSIDMIMVGKLGPEALATVGFCWMINWTLYALISGIGAGVTAIVARKVGSNQNAAAGRVVAQAIVLSLLLAAFSTAMMVFGGSAILGVFGVGNDILDPATSFLRIISFCNMIFAVLIPLENALIGAGDTRTSLWISIIQNTLNIGLNYLLIFGKFGFPALGVTGAAIGSVVSFFFGTVMLMLLFFGNRLKLRIHLHDFKWRTKQFKEFVRIGLPASLEHFVLKFGRLIYAKFVIVYGTMALSGYEIGNQIVGLSFIVNSGFAVAATTLVGQHLGALQKKKARIIGWRCLIAGSVSMAVLGIVFVFHAGALISIFAKGTEVVALGSKFLWVLAIALPFMAIEDILSGVLYGVGNTLTPFITTLIGMYLIRIPGAWFITSILQIGILAVFSMWILDYMLRAAYLLFFFQKGKWMKA